MASRRLRHLARNQGEPAPSTLLQASDQVPWTSVCSVWALPNLIILYKGKSSLLQPLMSGIWDSWRQVLPVKMEVKKKGGKKHWVFFHILCHRIPCSVQWWPKIFSSVPTADETSIATIPVVLHVPVRFSSRGGFSFLTPSVCNWAVPFTMLPTVLTHPAKCQFSTFTLHA